MKKLGTPADLGAGWRVHTDGRSPTHVWPQGDLREHRVGVDDEIDCPCDPTDRPYKMSDGSIFWLVTHRSFDGREVGEWNEQPGPD